MHQADTKENQISELPLTHLVCPTCKCFSSASNAKAVGDTTLGITMAYIICCEHCGEQGFLNYGGHPPIFELMDTKIFAYWRMAEA